MRLAPFTPSEYRFSFVKLLIEIKGLTRFNSHKNILQLGQYFTLKSYIAERADQDFTPLPADAARRQFLGKPAAHGCGENERASPALNPSLPSWLVAPGIVLYGPHTSHHRPLAPCRSATVSSRRSATRRCSSSRMHPSSPDA